MASNADMTRPAADRLFCSSLMRRGLCMCVPQPSPGGLSRYAVVAYTYVTLEPGHPRQTIFALERGFSQAFYHGS